MIENNNKVLMNIVDRIPDSIIITNEHDKIELINEKGISLFKLTDYEHKLLVSPIKSFLDKKEFSLSYADISHDVVGDIIYFPKIWEDSELCIYFRNLKNSKHISIN